MRDFVYNGESLFNDFGYVICSVGGASDESYTTEATRSYNHSSLLHGAYRPFTYSVYEDSIVMDFDIIKNPCVAVSANDARISLDESRALKRWLERASAKLLYFQHVNQDGTIITEDPDSEIDGVRFWGVFTTQEIWVGSLRIGLRLHFESNAASGFKSEMSYSKTITNVNTESFVITNNSDIDGYIYPLLTVKCLAAGTLLLRNDYDRAMSGEYRYSIVKNCRANETITFTPKLIVSSSVTTHEIYDDFNFVYQRIYSPHTDNTAHTHKNILRSSLPCEFRITFEEQVKVAI